MVVVEGMVHESIVVHGTGGGSGGGNSGGNGGGNGGG